MKEDIIETFKDAFCNELRDIKASLDNNGGHFDSDREIRNAMECIDAIKDLMKIESMESKTLVR